VKESHGLTIFFAVLFFRRYGKKRSNLLHASLSTTTSSLSIWTAETTREQVVHAQHDGWRMESQTVLQSMEKTINEVITQIDKLMVVM